MSMDADTELQTAREKVHQGIGRNLLLFQRAELMLKRLNALGALSRFSGDPAQNFAEQKAAFDKQTLGQQLKHFFDNHCVEKDPFNEPFEESGGSRVAFGFSFTESEPEGDAARKLSLDAFLDERNRLVHHMFAEYNSDSLDQCRDMIAKLDAQREKILPEFQRIAGDLRSIQEGFQCIAAFLETPEGMAALRLPDLQNSPVVQALIHLAAPNAQPDGWTPLHAVGKVIQQQSPGCLSEQIAAFESRSLSVLLLASQLFDLKYEKTDTGGNRTFYRLKDSA